MTILRHTDQELGLNARLAHSVRHAPKKLFFSGSMLVYTGPYIICVEYRMPCVLQY